MSDEHGHDDHPHYPGPDTHQAPWVMWVTIGACFAFLAFILAIKAITGTLTFGG